MEESKGSTSSEELEYESDVESEKVIASGTRAPPLKIVQYLSTNLIAGSNLTLADVEVSSCPVGKIKEMEDELIKQLRKVRIKPLLIDPKAEMKEQKAAGNTETLVDYEKIG